MRRSQSEAAERLKQREAELAEAQRLAHLGSWTWDVRTNTVNWSDELCRIYGFKPQEFPGTFEAFLACIHPDDRARTQAIVEDSVKTGKPYVDVRRIVRPDGEVRTVEARASVVHDQNGTPIRVYGTTQDITERERVLAALAEAERKHRDILDNLQEGMFQTTPDGRFIRANRALALMHGFDSPEELIRRRTNISRDAYVDPTRREEFTQVLETRDLVRGFEFELRRKDGTTIWVSTNARAVRDEHGAIQYYEGTAQDITERKKAQEELSASEERYRDLVESSHEFIGTHALDGLILSANKTAADALGVNLEDFVGKRKIQDLLAPEFRFEFDQYMSKLLENGASTGLMMVVASSGERRLWEYYNSLRTEGVAQPVVRGIARDITEQRMAERALRESEERYRELFENSRDAIYVHDLQGRYVSVNRAAEELSGYPREEILGKHYSNFVLPKYLKTVRENFCLKLDVPLETTYETQILCKDGTRKPVEVSSRIIYKNGQPQGVQGTARDITERKRAQRALQSYSRRLVNAQEAERESIARELHDEIGQALTAISINLEWIHRSGAVQESAVPRVRESIGVIEDALRQVRDLSFELRPSLLDDLGLAAALRWFAEHHSSRTGIATEVIDELPESNRIHRAVETACFRIAQEALTNVARHSGATQAFITLKLEAKLFLRMTITDNGRGFSPSGPAPNGRAPLALGLRGIEERALAVGGRVKISSAPGNGTEVSLLVPIASTPEPARQGSS